LSIIVIDESCDILASTEALLRSRPSRAPDYKSENDAVRHLTEEMAERPDQVLRVLCEQILQVCGAESAGVSLLETINADSDFYWPAIAGVWASLEGGGMPRSASPSGVVLIHDRPLIFHDVERQFPAAAGAMPPVAEILLAPFRVNGAPIGTVWAIVHSDAKRFDSEDVRLLESLARFAGAAYQMTTAERKATEAKAQLSIVNHELGHRLKNMLAMVMAIASQTLKGVGDRYAVNAFEARIQALGEAHDILLEQTWTAAPIRVIAEGVLETLGALDRVDYDGPEVMLGPRAALALSMTLHELGTNAIKYGALSVPEGWASFRWMVTKEAEPRLLATWLEEDGPPVTAPTRQGFGTRLIKMGLIGSGGVSLSYPITGVQADFEAPLRLVQDESREETIRAE
jgi:two-component sensor histidine kinase